MQKQGPGLSRIRLKFLGPNESRTQPLEEKEEGEEHGTRWKYKNDYISNANPNEEKN